jgi:hypothetical protein
MTCPPTLAFFVPLSGIPARKRNPRRRDVPCLLRDWRKSDRLAPARSAFWRAPCFSRLNNSYGYGGIPYSGSGGGR